MSLCSITSRPHKPWPKKRWIVRTRLVLVEVRDGIKRYESEIYEDYVYDWPCLQCRGSAGSRNDTAEKNEQHGLMSRAVKELEEARACFPD